MRARVEKRTVLGWNKSKELYRQLYKTDSQSEPTEDIQKPAWQKK